MNGIFPMADNDGTLYWYSPEPRAVIPIETYKPPKSLRPIINKKLFEVRISANFEQVMRNCAYVARQPRHARDLALRFLAPTSQSPNLANHVHGDHPRPLPVDKPPQGRSNTLAHF